MDGAAGNYGGNADAFEHARLFMADNDKQQARALLELWRTEQLGASNCFTAACAKRSLTDQSMILVAWIHMKTCCRVWLDSAHVDSLMAPSGPSTPRFTSPTCLIRRFGG